MGKELELKSYFRGRKAMPALEYSASALELSKQVKSS